jgi:acylphosphatase
MDVCNRFLIKGRVQGVFFRASTQEKAIKLGLKGFVRNRLDGSVEVFASGSHDQMEGFFKWLQEGPSSAKVVSAERESSILTLKAPFEIAPTS